jgi:antitoxin component HigA of HigAB toxin-antitoxin module
VTFIVVRSILASNSHNIISGLSPDALGQKPSDSEILRFSDQLDTDMIRKLLIHLGLSANEWKVIKYNNDIHGVTMCFSNK